MFSEPLAILLILASFYLIGSPKGRGLHLLMALSGLALGAASATHLTALLFLPFFYLYARSMLRGEKSRSALLYWILGVAVVIAFLGWYNFIRFGSLLESGRSLSGLNPIIFHHPLAPEFWRGLYGLLAGSGKGLLLFCPAVLLGAFGWRAMARRCMPLAIILGAAVLFRLMFVASYYDWHGGFCLGPRYLLQALPFLVLPFGFWFDEQLKAGRWKRLMLAAGAIAAFMMQQFYFALGDIFRYYHQLKLDHLEQGIDLFVGDRIYLDWSLSPLIHLLEYPRGAFMLHALPLSNMALWGAGSVVILLGGLMVVFWLKPRAG